MLWYRLDLNIISENDKNFCEKIIRTVNLSNVNHILQKDRRIILYFGPGDNFVTYEFPSVDEARNSFKDLEKHFNQDNEHQRKIAKALEWLADYLYFKGKGFMWKLRRSLKETLYEKEKIREKAKRDLDKEEKETKCRKS